MLRELVGIYLDSLTEREFDAPLMAVLSTQGFYDIHFLHGNMEFGKDVIAKRVDEGIVRQYAIQSKAGDIGLSEWRTIRPQVEEAQENILSHPNFDADLPRAAVLVTTGRLKGGATLDAQQVALRAAELGRPSFEMWERPQLVDWFAASPESARGSDAPALLSLIASIDQQQVSEPAIERFSRDWLLASGNESALAARVAIEGAVVSNRLRKAHRLDLAALTALHIFRAAWPSDYSGPRPALATRALGLFVEYVDALAIQCEPFLSHPNALLGEFLQPAAIVTYPAALCRLNELFAIRWLVGTDGDDGAARSGKIVQTLCDIHEACTRPISDQFAVSLIPVAMTLVKLEGKDAARRYLARCARWTLDRYDASESGLGLATLEETEEVACERVLGGTLPSTAIDRRSGSYVCTVLLDLCSALGLEDLYESLRHNAEAVQMVPSTTRADELVARWARGGQGVNPHPRLDYAGGDKRPHAAHHEWAIAGPDAPIDNLLLTTSCRSRHSFSALQQLASQDSAL